MYSTVNLEVILGCSISKIQMDTTDFNSKQYLSKIYLSKLFFFRELSFEGIQTRLREDALVSLSTGR